MHGKIKNYKSDKGFGFIIPGDGGSDIFFHLKSVSDKELPLDAETDVEFEVIESNGRLQAQNVRRKAIPAVFKKGFDLRNV